MKEPVQRMFTPRYGGFPEGADPARAGTDNAQTFAWRLGSVVRCLPATSR